MTQSEAQSPSSAAEAARAARAASRELVRLRTDVRNAALQAVARHYQQNADRILAANAQDCTAAAELVKTGKMSAAMFSRLCVTKQTISDMAERLCEVASLPDPLGRRLSTTELDEGLILYKETCPLGVIAVVFESRPDVVPQVASLALKSGNAILLKGGTEAFGTNECLVALWKEALRDFPMIPVESLRLLQARGDVMELLHLHRHIDLIIPRGGREFVEYIARNSRVPVLGHGEGICHVYVDQFADLDKALAITVDSKVQYPAACNAAETLLVHQAVADKFLPLAIAKLRELGVEIRGCPRVAEALPGASVRPASEEDWSTEYGDLVLSIKVVNDLDQALEHIQKFGSAHTEAIVTEDPVAASRFLEEVDAAGVYHNVSTRFGDGYRYGLGSEIGISTSKLHARGPMGLEGLTTYKYKLVGNGHVVATYSRGERKFRHRHLPPEKT